MKGDKLIKTISIGVLVFSLLILVYCIGFYLDYMVTYKYTVDDGFSNIDITIPKSNRGDEIKYLLLYSKVIFSYALIVTINLIWWLYKSKKKNS